MSLCVTLACDDEIHFLTKCHFHSDERNRLFKQFNDVSKHFKDMLDKDKVTYLMSVNGENIVKVAKYCFEGFEKRKNADLY